MVWCRAVLLIWIIVRQGPTVLVVGAGGVVFTFFLFPVFLSPTVWETAQYTLKYHLKELLNLKHPPNQTKSK